MAFNRADSVARRDVRGAGTMTSAPEALVTEVVTSPQRWRPLAREWNELVDRDALASPFQDYEWLYSWSTSVMKASSELHIVTFRTTAERLVAVLPLHLDGSGPRRTLRWLGEISSDHLDAIVHTGREGESYAAMARWLSVARSSGLELRLRDVPECGHLLQAVERLASPCAEVERGSRSLLLPGKDWPAVLGSLDPKRRETARRALRRMESDGLRWVKIDSDRAEVRRAAATWVELHRSYWEGRGLIPAHATDAFESFVTNAVEEWHTSRRPSGIFELRTPDGGIVISDLLLASPRIVVSYLFGATPEARLRYEINTLLMENWMRVARETGAAGVWLGRGDEPYKLKWLPESGVTLHVSVNSLDPAVIG